MDKENSRPDRPETDAEASTSSSSSSSASQSRKRDRRSRDLNSNRASSSSKRLVIRPRFQLRAGNIVDALDGVDCWTEALIKKVVEKSDHYSVLVHYLYWDSKYDAWIRVSHSQISNPDDKSGASLQCLRFGSRTYQEGGTFRVGQRVDLLDIHPAQNKWTEGDVIAVEDSRIKVHFRGWAAKFDEWLSKGSRRIKPFGRETRRQFCADHKVRITAMRNEALRMFNLKAPMAASNRPALASKSNNVSLSLSDAGANAEALRRQGWETRKVAGDGNCLFRAVSHQLFGTEEHHPTLRRLCMDYMENERAYFQPFVAVANAEEAYLSVDSADAFARYVERKRRHGVWGDEPEIQALCELFRVSAVVYGLDDSERNLRVFQQYEMGIEGTVRLFYLGRCHYDSIVDVDRTFRGILPPSRLSCEAERRRIQLCKDRGSGDVDLALRMSEKEAVEQGLIDEAIRQSRRHFDSIDLEVQSLSNQDLEERIVSAAMAESEEAAELEMALKASAEEAKGSNDALQRALRESREEAKGSDDALEMALRESRSESKMLSEEEQLQMALQASVGGGVDAMIFGNSDEDALLQAAMMESLKER